MFLVSMTHVYIYDITSIISIMHVIMYEMYNLPILDKETNGKLNSSRI